MDNGKQNFFDQKTLLAIVLTTMVWLGWQFHLQKKYPKTEPIPVAGEVVSSAPVATDEQTVESPKEVKPETQTTSAEELVHIEDENWSFDISTHGMGIKNFKLKKFSDRFGSDIAIGTNELPMVPFSTGLVGFTQPLIFKVEKVGDTGIVGIAEHNGLRITKKLEFVSSQYRINTELTVDSNGRAFLGLKTVLSDGLLIPESTSFLAPNFERQEIYALGEGSQRTILNPKENAQVEIQKVKVASIGSQYFSQTILDQSQIVGRFKAGSSVEKKTVSGEVEYSSAGTSEPFSVRYVAIIGPKDLHLLKSIDETLVGVVDFGFFALIGRPILAALKWFYNMTGNWGVAIILLTLLVRFLVLPFNVVSFKSMKAMQTIQPIIADLKERYKNDQTRLNQEMIQLFKTYKVNPLGGCLPVLLQIPVFFALYQVLGHSVELYQAPFMMWISDLSYKDPYFVLPVLMGVTMFFQMKISPTTADPMQAKILMFMPIIMTVFMLTLPSGLTLYIFISTLFGITQQLYLMKSHGTSPGLPAKN